MEYKVPRVLWENLEAVLLAQSKRYIGELALRLGVSEKELQKKVLPTSDSLKVLIYDSHVESHQCKAYIQHDQVTIFCKDPVTLQSEYCIYHKNKRMTVIEGTPQIIQRVKDSNMHEPIWIKDNIVINSSGNTVGKLNRSENKIKLFVI